MSLILSLKKIDVRMTGRKFTSKNLGSFEQMEGTILEQDPMSDLKLLFFDVFFLFTKAIFQKKLLSRLT
jgi:hypothetical protein